MQKIRKDDQVIVLAGKDKGKQGKVLKILHGEDKVIVEGINLVKKHTKPNPQSGVGGGIISREAAIHISNVAIYNSMTKKADRVSIHVLKDGTRERRFKSNKESIDI